jgi:hypothetical protein
MWRHRSLMLVLGNVIWGTAMTETKLKSRWFQFTVINLFLLTALAALGIAWLTDHRRQVAQVQFYVDQVQFYKVHMEHLGGNPDGRALVAALKNCTSCHMNK